MIKYIKLSWPETSHPCVRENTEGKRTCRCCVPHWPLIGWTKLEKADCEIEVSVCQFFLSVLFIGWWLVGWNRIPLCSPGCPRTDYVDKASLKHTEIHQPLPPTLSGRGGGDRMRGGREGKEERAWSHFNLIFTLCWLWLCVRVPLLCQSVKGWKWARTKTVKWFFCCCFCLMRQVFSVQVSLYRLGWPQTQRTTYLCFPGAGVEGVCQHAQQIYISHRQCICYLYCWDRTAQPKQGRKGLFGSHFLAIVAHGGRSGRNWSQSCGGMLLPSSLSVAHSTYIIAQQWQFPQWAGPWAVPHQSLIKKMPHGQSGEDMFSVGIPSSQVTLACVELVKQNKT